MSEQMGSVAEEKLDFTNDKTVETETKTWTISDAEIKRSENGLGTYLSVSFQDEDTPFPREERFWLKHDEVPGKNIEQMVKIARANAKRLFNAALGKPAVDDVKELIGVKVVATIEEDNRGFAHFKGYKPAAAGEAVS